MNIRSVAVGVGLVALAAACGSSSSNTADTAPTHSPKATPTAHHHHHHHTATPTPTVVTTTASTKAPKPPVATVTATVTPTVTPTVTSTVAPVASRCLSSNLSLSLGLGQGAAGTTYQTVVFTNRGGAACELHGYPGVSFVDSSGGEIGRPAAEDPSAIHTITLAAGGGQANALLRQPDPGNFAPGMCHMTTASRLRVYPPGETVPLFVPDAAQVCSTSAGRTGIGPMLAGNGG